MPVVFVVLDAFPNDVVSPEVTPVLCSLADEGGWHPSGGVAEMSAATYPNHATFVTGRSTLEHGVITNRVLRDGEWIPSAEVGPAAPTIFDACASQNRRSVAVVGDQYLIGVCGAAADDAHWPPKGDVPDGVDRNVGGYIADHEVVAAAADLDIAAADFVFAQLDAVDAMRHATGASSPEALEQCARTDAALGSLLELFRPVWADTAVIAVSDHDQEDLNDRDPIDLAAALPDAYVHHQGTAAQVVGDVDPTRLMGIPSVEGITSFDTTHHVVWGGPGQRFGTRVHPGLRADHGSPRTRTQVAVVGGGHPGVAALAAQVGRRRPAASDWMGHCADLLGLRSAHGRNDLNDEETTT